jgi:competence protein ComEA
MKRLLLAFVLLFAASVAFAAVNLNTATKEELDALPGIGPVKAQAIIDYRNANGPFRTPEDVMKVRGIKEGEFGKIRDQISVSGSTTPAQRPAARTAAPATPAPRAAAAPAPVTPAPAASPAPARTAGPASTATAPATAAPAKADNAKMTKAEEKAARAKAREEKAAKAKEEKAAKAKEKQEKAAKAKEDKAARAEATKTTVTPKDKAAAEAPAKDAKPKP